MLETMVSLAIVAAAMAYALQLAQTGDDQAQGRADADALSSFSQLAAQFFISHRAAMEQAMDDGTDAGMFCRVGGAADGSGGTVANSSSKKTCALDASLLLVRGAWPAGMPLDTFGGRYVAIFRRIYDAGGAATGGTDMLTVLAALDGTLQAARPDARRLEQLAAAQATLGGMGGVVPAGTLGDCVASRASASFEVCGNGWRVRLSDFVDPPQLSIFTAALPE